MAKDIITIEAAELEAGGIKDAAAVLYGRYNLIVGENGSGKTRFLKCVEKYKQSSRTPDDDEYAVITLYFPEISSFFSGAGATDGGFGGDIYIYDILRGNTELDFKDFLKIMERADDRLIFIGDFKRWLDTHAINERRKAAHAFDKLNETLMQLLNRNISFDERSGDIVINKHMGGDTIRACTLENAFSESEMSPGELMLFYFALFQYYMEVACKKKMVLIVDEPEQHIHPQKLILLVKTLMASDMVAELWMASHSLFLVPLFEFEGIVLMEHSRVLPRGSGTYKKLYASLVGLDNFDTLEFLKSIESWQYYQFISECFCLPITKDKIDVKDEQFLKTLERLEAIQIGRPLDILDYGAGKCRIWDCLKLKYHDRTVLDSLLTYTAYEPYPDPDYNYDKTISLYSDIHKLRHDTYDVVILMNVLHEVPVTDWSATLRTVGSLLNESGIAIFLEVKSLTRGEQPYGDTGYLVLQDAQAESLFKPSARASANENSKDKSNCWVIPRANLTLIEDSDVERCVKALAVEVYSELSAAFKSRIKAAHEGAAAAYKAIPARRYAFLSQQYLNAGFAIEILREQMRIERKAAEKDAVPGAQIKIRRDADMLKISPPPLAKKQ